MTLEGDQVSDNVNERDMIDRKRQLQSIRDRGHQSIGNHPLAPLKDRASPHLPLTPLQAIASRFIRVSEALSMKNGLLSGNSEWKHLHNPQKNKIMFW
jgi:hypothetical protein